MPVFDNINGVYRKVQKQYDNINGVQREVKNGYSNVNGVWRKDHTAGLQCNVVQGIEVPFRLLPYSAGSQTRGTYYSENIYVNGFHARLERPSSNHRIYYSAVPIQMPIDISYKTISTGIPILVATMDNVHGIFDSYNAVQLQMYASNLPNFSISCGSIDIAESTISMEDMGNGKTVAALCNSCYHDAKDLSYRYFELVASSIWLSSDMVLDYTDIVLYCDQYPSGVKLEFVQ